MACAAAPLAGCGQVVPLSTEGLLGAAVVTGTGGTRVDGSNLGNIYTVYTVVPATSGNPYATTAELPLTGPAASIGSPVTNGQTPFHFDYAYPANNYKLAGAHIVIDTQRDTSDTEGIFVDGVFSGTPPTSMINYSSPRLTYPITAGNTAGYTPNTYYIDYAIAHYKQLTRNTYDLNIDQLLTPTTVQTLDLVKDGFLPVVTGDDSEVFQGYLVLQGYTISKSALTCVNSPSYTFQNVLLHNDGNSIGTAAFTGTVDGPFTSWGTTQSAFQSVEFFYDDQLPRVNVANVTVSSGSIVLTVKRTTTAYAQAAIVINGVGTAESGFDTTKATPAVESWATGAGVSYWSSWVQAIPAEGAAHTVTLDLVSLLGATPLRTLLAQGKFNVSLAGSLGMVQASGASSGRHAGAPVSGPELSIAGTYFTQLCDVPNDPSSPLSDAQALPSNVGDHTSPVVNSMQASQVTSSSAVIQWLTDEGATSQVGYGIGNTSSLTVNDPTLTTFHSVTLTGLQAYKVYTFRVYTADGNNNLTATGTKTFQTLR